MSIYIFFKYFVYTAQPSLGFIGNIGFPLIGNKEELIIPPFTGTSSHRFGSSQVVVNK